MATKMRKQVLEVCEVDVPIWHDGAPIKVKSVGGVSVVGNDFETRLVFVASYMQSGEVSVVVVRMDMDGYAKVLTSETLRFRAVKPDDKVVKLSEWFVDAIRKGLAIRGLMVS